MSNKNIAAAKFFGKDRLVQAGTSPQLQTLVSRTIRNILFVRCGGSWDMVTMSWFLDNITRRDVESASGSGPKTADAVQTVLKKAGYPELP